tara:strand:- start:10214 stop:10426 length:213 start_codon:yes stop_codon:yes gene_type:complete
MTMKKLVDGVVQDMTAEEIAQGEQDTINANARKDAEETANQEKADLKASAKQKLINGEPLTEEEADTIVL